MDWLLVLCYIYAVVPFIAAQTLVTSSKVCTTMSGSKSIKQVPTLIKNTHLTSPRYRVSVTTSITTPLVVVTPEPITSTVTVAETALSTVTADQSTDTVVSTTTSSTIATTTISSLRVFTATLGYTPTRTVTFRPPLPSSWLPVESTITENYWAWNKKRRRSIFQESENKARSRNEHPLARRLPRQYPTSVVCQITYTTFVSSTKTVITTASPSTSTADAETTVVSITATVTAVETAVPQDATATTITTYATTGYTTETTTIISLTTTFTSDRFVQTRTTFTTVYPPICTGTNILWNVNEDGNGGFTFNQGYGVMSPLPWRPDATLQTSSPEECCASCLRNSTCAGSAWFQGDCFLVPGGCTEDHLPASILGPHGNAGFPPDMIYGFGSNAESYATHYSNGICGKWDSFYFHYNK